MESAAASANPSPHDQDHGQPAPRFLRLPSPSGQLAACRPQAFARRLSRMVRMAFGRALAQEILVVHHKAR
jgi:hypothetical protein